MALPRFKDLYNAARDLLDADPDYQFNDFSAGSWLDSFAAVVAAECAAVARYARRRFLSAFIASAEGAELDYLVYDRYRMTRKSGESDAELIERVYREVDNLAKATPAALRVYAEGIEGVSSALVSEDLLTGITTIALSLEAGAVEATVIADVQAGLDGVRAAGRWVNVEAV